MDRAESLVRSAVERQQVSAEHGYQRAAVRQSHVALRHPLLRHQYHQHEAHRGARVCGRRQNQGKSLGGVYEFFRHRARRARWVQRRRLDAGQHANPGDQRRGGDRHGRLRPGRSHEHGCDGNEGNAPHPYSAGDAAMTQAARRIAPRRTLRGFTLIEVLVALLILGIMSALGYGTYRAARISAERTEESLKRSREIEFGMRVLVMDFAQIVPRPVRDPLGQSRLPALHGQSGNGTSAGTADAGSNALGANSTMHFDTGPGFQSTFTNSSSNNSLQLAELTRGGWSNTAGQQRSTLQRVSYALVDDVLKRSYTTALDTVQGAKPVVQDLFGGVKTIQFRYLDGNQAWQNQWPIATVTQQEGLALRPVAVEITIEFKDWGRIRRLIEVAG